MLRIPSQSLHLNIKKKLNDSTPGWGQIHEALLVKMHHLVLFLDKSLLLVQQTVYC